MHVYPYYTSGLSEAELLQQDLTHVTLSCCSKHFSPRKMRSFLAPILVDSSCALNFTRVGEELLHIVGYLEIYTAGDRLDSCITQTLSSVADLG
jgi:hypothetical protein